MSSAVVVRERGGTPFRQIFSSRNTHTHTHTGRYSLGECTGAARGPVGTPPALRNWVHEKMPGCAVELNRPTQNSTWFGSQISLITAISFRAAMPRNHPPGALPLDPAGGLPFSRPPLPPPPHPDCATGRVVSASDCGVKGPRFQSRRPQLCLSRQLLQYTALGTGCAPLLQCLGRLSLPPSVGR